MSNQAKHTNSTSLKRQFNIIVITPILFFTIVLILILFLFEYRNEVNDDYVELVKLERSIYKHQKAMLDMETGVRGLIITKDRLFLAPYYSGLQSKEDVEQEVLENYDEKPQILSQFQSIIESADNWYNKIALVVIESDPKNYKKSIDFGKKAKNIFDTYRREIKKFKSSIHKKRIALKKSASKIRTYSVIFAILSGLLLIVLIYTLLRKRISHVITHYNELIEKEASQKIELLEASRSKDLFLANMSHEIRTPLGAIIGFSNLAYEDPNLSPETKKNIGFVTRNSSHLLGLVEDLFDLTKIGNDKLDLQSENSDLLEIIKDVKSTFEEKTKSRDQTFIFSIEGDLPRRISTDQLRFKQILTNLIGNAVKFTKAGKSISCTFKEHKQRLQIDIIDEGIGIDPDKQKLIYNSFQQADSEHSRLFGGAGLGLSISKNLISLMGGDLELVWSQKGIGSHFRLVFPLDKNGKETFNQTALSNRPINPVDINLSQSLSKTSLKDLKILIAEDSKENQILFKIFTESAGAVVEIVENGKDAIRYALSGSYDIILMDIQMPGLDGYQAVKSLRESDYEGKIIALTAHALKGDRQKTLAAGFDEYLSKPVSKEKLVSTILNQIQS